MTILGLSLLGYEAPLDNVNIKKVVIYLEIDRCAADAIASVSGVKLGRRSLKFKDYGIMAATFVNLPDKRAFRVCVNDECRSLVQYYAPEGLNKVQSEIEAYKRMPAGCLFKVEEVSVDIRPEDIPGHNRDKVQCDICGVTIRHRREVIKNNRTLCTVCAGNAYFKSLQHVQDVNSLDPVIGKGLFYVRQ